MRNAIVMFFLCAVVGVASATEKKLTEAEVPRPVVETVKKKYPKAKIVEYELESEDGQSLYEVKLVDGEQKIEVHCTKDGRVSLIETEIALETIPAAVRDALKKSKYADRKLERAEKLTTEDPAAPARYEIYLAAPAGRMKLIYDAQGKLERVKEPRR